MRAPDGPLLAKGDVLLAVEKVSLRFGGVKALTDVSFDIRKGEIRAIIGPNGAGKTSMLNCINGFYHPTEGRITFKGKTRARMRPSAAARGGIARTFQNVALFKGMSTLDNIMAGRTLKMRRGLFWQLLRFGPAEAEEIEHRKRVEEIIDLLEIEHIRKVPVGRLPYGLQKRVELARALAMEPDLLLLDEPMAGMNVEEKEDMCRFILDVNEQFGTTIALGFVLIFKASGVFNFAQGIMVVFAALTLVGLHELGVPALAALGLALAVMFLLAVAIERAVLRPLVNQPDIILFMATFGLTYVLIGLGELIFGGNPKQMITDQLLLPRGSTDVSMLGGRVSFQHID